MLGLVCPWHLMAQEWAVESVPGRGVLVATGGGLAGSHVSGAAARPRTGKAPLGPIAVGAGRGIFAP